MSEIEYCGWRVRIVCRCRAICSAVVIILTELWRTGSTLSAPGFDELAALLLFTEASEDAVDWAFLGK